MIEKLSDIYLFSDIDGTLGSAARASLSATGGSSPLLWKRADILPSPTVQWTMPAASPGRSASTPLYPSATAVLCTITGWREYHFTSHLPEGRPGICVEILRDYPHIRGRRGQRHRLRYIGERSQVKEVSNAATPTLS